MTPTDASSQIWDVIIIGAGMGGGIAGRRLAEKGLSVLYVEKGLYGHEHEQQALDNSISEPISRLSRGYWPKQAEAHVNGVKSRFFAPIGCGVGGSSVFYAGCLERPEPHDMNSSEEIPHPTGGWPVSYEAYQPYFDQAEDILHIYGEQDPLSKIPAQLNTPPALSEGEAKMILDFKSLGLNPYRLHVASRNIEECEHCMGHKCPRLCKMDGRSAGVVPALKTGKAHLLDNASVLELKEEQGRITALAVQCGSEQFDLNAHTYVLAAGSFGSPRLLLASKGSNENGLANSSDWVGRGLMFHMHEYFALWPRKEESFDGATKSIAFRDFYTHKGQRLGVVQSMGIEAGYGDIALHMKNVFNRSVFRRFKIIEKFLSIPAAIAARIFGSAKLFCALFEDMPYKDNRVLLNSEDPEILTFQYHIHDELKSRRKLFRKLLKKVFRKRLKFFLFQQPELNYGHPCGTLRFGTDPKTSVLDAQCKAHDLENLYVADASFMPTSMGTNPSLMIAANALRVADIIAEKSQTDGET